MGSSAEHPNGHRMLELAGALDLNAAGPLADSLLKHVGEDLVLDGSKVQRLGAPCLQVLLAAAKTWAGDRAALSLDNPSARLVEDLKLLGFDAMTFLDGATQQ